MPTINLYFISHTRVVESASERTNRAKIEAGWHPSTTSLASRCDFCFHGRKSLVEGSFAKDYNSSPPSVHRFVETPGNELARCFRCGRRTLRLRQALRRRGRRRRHGGPRRAERPQGRKFTL